MERIIVQVQVESKGPRQDLEVPAGIPTIELAALLAQALYQEQGENMPASSFYIELPFGGRILDADKTLMQANVWDGATIILKKLPFAFLESDAKRKYPILFPVVHIGRCHRSGKDSCNKTNFINLGDEPMGKTVHRQHVLLALHDDKWFFSRLRGARNVTKINDQVVRSGHFYPVSDSDRIVLGGVKLWFRER